MGGRAGIIPIYFIGDALVGRHSAGHLQPHDPYLGNRSAGIHALLHTPHLGGSDKHLRLVSAYRQTPDDGM